MDGPVQELDGGQWLAKKIDIMKLQKMVIFSLLLSIGARAGKAPSDPVNSPPSATADSFPTGRVIASVGCQQDAGQSYALYIPVKRRKTTSPVIYFFDPHGAGALPLCKYKSLAEEFGFILIGSNNSKNGNDWSTTETMWNVLSEDTRKRLPLDPDRIYTAGFSGGAKVASYVALHHPGIKGVLAGGAGLPDGTRAGDFAFSFTALAGQGDMNRTDLIAITGELDKTRTRHRLISFEGIHEWAPDNTMRIAFAGLQLDAMRQGGTLPPDTPFIDQYVKSSQKRIAVYYQAGQLLKAEEECRLSLRLMEGLPADSDWFKKKEAALIANPLYGQQQREQQRLLVIEQNKKAEYQGHFQQEDRDYWIRTINGLQILARGKTNASAMNQRLLAYLSLAFYSFSNRLINGNENQGARYFVELYKIADPANTEAWYFSAILHVREGHAPEAEKDIDRAIEYGFRDRSRLEQQPEFKGRMSRIKIPK